MVQLLGNVALAEAALAFIVFVIMYQVTALWRETRMGRHMMTFNLVVAVILSYAFVSTVFGPLPAREWVRLTVFAAIGAVGWWRVALLWKEQRDARRELTLRGKHHLPE
jgi:hypothetical protein